MFSAGQRKPQSIANVEETLWINWSRPTVTREGRCIQIQTCATACSEDSKSLYCPAGLSHQIPKQRHRLRDITPSRLRIAEVPAHFICSQLPNPCGIHAAVSHSRAVVHLLLTTLRLLLSLAPVIRRCDRRQFRFENSPSDPLVFFSSSTRNR